MIRRRSLYTGLLLLLSFSLVLPLLPTPAPADEPAAPRKPVRLVVFVVFDQFRGDYLTRWDALFAEDGGFHRLEKGGAWFLNCQYPYGTTVTGAGHATLSTGCTPSVHGIIDNEWYRRDTLGLVYCATNPERHRVPPAEKLSAKEKKVGSGSPENLLVEATIGDALKAAYAKAEKKPRVVSLSIKDRAAVLLGGKNPDAAYWLDSADGKFVTSSYYRDSVHPWIAEFNSAKLIDSYFAKDWSPLQPKVADSNYWQDNGKDRGEGFKQGYVFPHTMSGGLEKPGGNYYDALTNSPYGNELLLALAKTAIEKEQLGSRETPDLLLLSFSCNDLIGHAWGPDSPEVLDVTLRTDLLLKDLLAYLDKQVGKDNYLVVLSADHGVCPLPEVTAARKAANPALPLPEAKSLDLTQLQKDAQVFLNETFVKPADASVACFAGAADNSFYLEPRFVKNSGVKQEVIEKALADWLKKSNAVLTAYTRTELLKGALPTGDVIGQKVLLSFQPDRSGDVIWVIKPYWYARRAKYRFGTGHGTPHEYDTHVPLLVYGPGVKPGVRAEAVTPLAVVPILAQALAIAPPKTTMAPVPPKLFTD